MKNIVRTLFRNPILFASILSLYADAAANPRGPRNSPCNRDHKNFGFRPYRQGPFSIISIAQRISLPFWRITMRVSVRSVSGIGGGVQCMYRQRAEGGGSVLQPGVGVRRPGEL